MARRGLINWRSTNEAIEWQAELSGKFDNEFNSPP